MKSWKLSTRIVSSVMTVVILGIVFLSIAVAGFTRYEITERLDNSLQEVSERLQTMVAGRLRSLRSTSIAWLPEAGPRTLAYQVLNDAGEVVLRSQNAPTNPFVIDRKTGFINIPQFRVYVAAAGPQKYQVLVGEPMIHRGGAIRRAVLISLTPMLIFLPVIWWLVRLIVYRALRPLDQLHDEMRSRGSGNLLPISPLGLPDELVTIQKAVNTLLGRLETALSTERSFAASAAHELRNPLGALMAQVQMLRCMLPEGSSLNERVELIANRTRGLARTVEKLLQLSRASSGIAFRRDRFDLLAVMQVLVDDLSCNLPVDALIIFKKNGFSGVFIYGDMDATGILLRNILENSLLHRSHATPVIVSILPDGTITITNDCIAVPHEILTKITNPFVRGGTTVHGSGLGLSIANNIAKQMDAKLSFYSPIPCTTRGFGVTLQFPDLKTQKKDRD